MTVNHDAGRRAGMPPAAPGAAAAAGPAAWPRPACPRLSAWVTYLVQHVLAPNALYRWLAGWLERSRLPYRVFTSAEWVTKNEIFGCRMCGQCTLPVTGYSCPMTCPKQLRNGPCGGVGADGSCEVYPGERCVWLVAYERAGHHGRTRDLRLLQRPVDHRLWGSSSWVSYWSGRDEGLWTSDDGLDSPPGIRRAPRSFLVGR